MKLRTLLVAAMVLSVSSCGGGDASPPQREGSQITKTRLLERGDAICRRDQARVSAQLTRIPKPARSAAVGPTLVPYLELNEAAIRTGTARLTALGRPGADAGAFDAYLDERTTAANALRAAIAAASRDDTSELEAAVRTYSRTRAQEEATRFGFKVCGLGAGQVEP